MAMDCGEKRNSFVGLLQRFMEKVVHKAIRLFVKASLYLSDDVKEVFIDQVKNLDCEGNLSSQKSPV